MIILRENQHKLTRDGSQTIDYQSKKFGIITKKTSGNPRIILLAAEDRIPVLSKHWKRVLPAILKSIPLEDRYKYHSLVVESMHSYYNEVIRRRHRTRKGLHLLTDETHSIVGVTNRLRKKVNERQEMDAN